MDEQLECLHLHSQRPSNLIVLCENLAHAGIAKNSNRLPMKLGHITA